MFLIYEVTISFWNKFTEQTGEFTFDYIDGNMYQGIIIIGLG